ncbi:uncharacterized protein LOC110232807 [Exaiptasia diaphana]|uniref:Uncharacterized protein n=1 Tax=Exaiptasia diaphana TaxID=2652724 RepID=A0A913WT14_EXADI|nr:uncharacterized protein LOC110232807 [Exaiptasia diaphana]
MASSLQDFPSVTYESDQEIPNWQPCLIIHTYQNNHLRGHYLKIKGDRITANACQGDNNITLSYATFADNESSDLIIICDSSKKRFLAYKDDYNGPAIYIKVNQY